LKTRNDISLLNVFLTLKVKLMKTFKEYPNHIKKKNSQKNTNLGKRLDPYARSGHWRST